MLVPSGDHAGCMLRPPSLVSCTVRPPGVNCFRKISNEPFSSEQYARVFPSGEKEGYRSITVELVTCSGVYSAAGSRFGRRRRTETTVAVRHRAISTDAHITRRRF